jgi:pimeloyl-ACP methyl ester carboxylesterase
MAEIEVPAGTIEYDDTGGDGSVVLLLHGLGMDGSLWRHVVTDLRDGYRCVVPTLPLGSHRYPMRPDADLTLNGHARIVADFLERLDLNDVTVVQNDINIAAPLVNDHPERVSRLVLVACEAFDNYPPGLPGRMIKWAVRVPGGLFLAFQPLRFRAMRRLPPFGMLAKRPIPDHIADRWLRPLLTESYALRDLRKYARSAETAQMVEATERLRQFDKPVLVVWAPEDRMMPPEHGRRLVELLPDAELVEIPDSWTLIPEDRPAELASALRAFLDRTAGG